MSGKVDKGLIVSAWSVRKGAGVSTISMCMAIETTKRLADKRILWLTTNPYFCPVDRALAIKCDRYLKSIDVVLDHIRPSNTAARNVGIVNEAVVNVVGINNLDLLLESNTKDRDYVQQNIKNFKSVIMPLLKEIYDIIFIDTCSFITSETTKYLLKNSDIVLNILMQNSVALDEYLRHKDEFLNSDQYRINLINAIRSIQPSIKTIRKDYEKNVFEIHDDVDFISSCNTGNLMNYLSRSTNVVTKDLSNIVDEFMHLLKLDSSASNRSERSTKPEKKGSIIPLFNTLDMR